MHFHVAIVLFGLCVSANQVTYTSLDRLEEDIGALENAELIASRDESLEEINFPVDVDMQNLSPDAKDILSRLQRRDDRSPGEQITWEQYFRTHAPKLKKFKIMQYIEDTDLNCFGYAFGSKQYAMSPGDFDLSRYGQVSSTQPHKYAFYFNDARPVLRPPDIKDFDRTFNSVGVPVESLKSALRAAKVLHAKKDRVISPLAVADSEEEPQIFLALVKAMLKTKPRPLIADPTVAKCETKYNRADPADHRTIFLDRADQFVKFIQENGQSAAFDCVPFLNRLRNIVDPLYWNGRKSLTAPLHMVKHVRGNVYEGLLHAENHNAAIVFQHGADDLKSSEYRTVVFMD